MNEQAFIQKADKAPTVKLTRTEKGWSYRGLEIRKRTWDLPLSGTSYRLVNADGKEIIDQESLVEMRELLAAMEADGWDKEIAYYTENPSL